MPEQINKKPNEIDDPEVEIVLVEDDPGDAELITRALRKQNLTNRIVLLKDGVEAIDYFFARGRFAARDTSIKPRVILLDLKLPRINGIEVLRKIKSDERTRKIPVVVLTSSAEGRDIKDAYGLGVNSYVTKPIRFEDFVRAVSDLGFYWMLLSKPLPPCKGKKTDTMDTP